MRLRRTGKHLTDRDAARRGQVVARQPDEGEQMPPEDAAHQHQLGARPIRQRHGGERDVLQRFRRKRGDQIMRQRRQRVRQRLAGMALGRIETELLFQRGQPRAQHGHLLAVRR